MASQGTTINSKTEIYGLSLLRVGACLSILFVHCLLWIGLSSKNAEVGSYQSGIQHCPGNVSGSDRTGILNLGISNRTLTSGWTSYGPQ